MMTSPDSLIPHAGQVSGLMASTSPTKCREPQMRMCGAGPEPSRVRVRAASRPVGCRAAATSGTRRRHGVGGHGSFGFKAVVKTGARGPWRGRGIRPHPSAQHADDEREGPSVAGDEASARLGQGAAGTGICGPR